GEVADLVRASGYAYWAQGPSRSEGFAKLTGAGLHVLSDAPITDVRSAAYRDCAGLDCLANKGVMLARLALPGAPVEVDVVNTHLNSKRASRAPLAQSLKAHNRQTEALIGFIKDHRDAGAPLLVGGDFNVKGAPARYDHLAAARPYRVVSEYCSAPASACEGQAPAVEPWLRSQDLQAFTDGGPVAVRPVKVETVFAGAGRLSDHDGYLVRYRLSWTPQTAPARPPNPLAVRPAGRGLKVSWTY
ncbi:MAG: endonuclease, partial [Phenylobacterium sp.]